jgi:hypothetical protein
MTDCQLPPLPWDWVAAGKPNNNGSFHAYLVDANGRKIAAIWGRGNEKEAIADFILRATNESCKQCVRETIALQAETVASSYEREMACAKKKQTRTVPDPQLSQIKAQHWRILAKWIRERR